MLTQPMKVLSVYSPKSSNVMTHWEPLYRDYFSEDHDESYRRKKITKTNACLLLFTLPECPPYISFAHPAPYPVKKRPICIKNSDIPFQFHLL